MSRACRIERHDGPLDDYPHSSSNHPIHGQDNQSVEGFDRLTRQSQAEWAERISQLRRMLIEEESSPQLASNQALLRVAEEVLDFLDLTRWRN